MKLGSLCSGYGGLDLAVHAVIGGELAWCAEIDPAASRVLEHRFGVLNLGDFRGQDPDPVDVLTAGFPCQPVSTAGKRQGTDDERWLFDDICTLVGRMDPRPRLLVFENVLGLLSANSGDAMARVVHGLARLGYVGRWGVVRASDAGAPHQRARVFIVAADAADNRLEHPGARALSAAIAGGCHGVAADAAGAARRGPEQQAVPASVGSAAEPGERHSAAPADAERRAAQLRRGPGELAGTPGGTEGTPRQRQRGRDAVGDRCAAPADADGAARRQPWSASEAVHEPGTVQRPGRCDRVAWGPYEAAVARWEHVLGRPAPAPVDDRGRLNPWLVEWMMGLPEGWVCDVIDRRTDALRMLGNGVVPQQAALALRMLGVGPC